MGTGGTSGKSGRVLRGLVRPVLEDLDLLRRPGVVAGHVPGLQPLEDRVGVAPDIGLVPQVERPLHLGPVGLPEQRLDVLAEAQLWLVGHCSIAPSCRRRALVSPGRAALARAGLVAAYPNLP